jgi:hypothetical protein
MVSAIIKFYLQICLKKGPAKQRHPEVQLGTGVAISVGPEKTGTNCFMRVRAVDGMKLAESSLE